jgi:hypothetical protein
VSTRQLVAGVALVFTAFFAALTIRVIVRTGFDVLTITSLFVLALFGIALFGVYTDRDE